MTQKASQKIKSLLGLLISIALLIWLGYSFNLKEIVGFIQTANYLYLLPIPLVLFLNFIVRAMRWQLLFLDSTPVKFGKVFRSLMVGYLFNNLLPARAGEFIKIHMLGRLGHISRGTVLGSVIIEKVADLLIMITLLCLILIYYPVPIWAERAGGVVGMVGLTTLASIVAIRFIGEKLTTIVIAKLSFFSITTTQRIKSVSDAFVQGISGLFHRVHLFRFIFYSGVIWALEIWMVYLTAQAFSLTVSFSDALLILIVISIGTMVPSSPGYVGTYEFFGVAALALLNITGPVALAFVISLHALMLLGSSIIGWVCLATRPLKEKLLFQPDNDREDFLIGLPSAMQESEQVK